MYGMEGILPNKIVEIDVKIGICIFNDLFMYLINHSVNQVKYHTCIYVPQLRICFNVYLFIICSWCTVCLPRVKKEMNEDF